MSRSIHSAKSTGGADHPGWIWWLGQSCLHATGTAAVAVVTALLLLGTGHLQWLAGAHRNQGDLAMLLEPLAVHLGLSGVLWTVVALTLGGLLRRRRQPARHLRPSAGTAVTETLVVMPVLLLLILGTAQLAVNNIAGMLFNYGTSQAVRAAWVWQPEVEPLHGGEGRMGVDEAWVEEMVRLRVAAAMTPVAPSNFASNRDIQSEQFKQLRAIFLSMQMVSPPDDAGRVTLGDAHHLDDFATADELHFKNALDGGSFPRRTVRKLTSAYEAVDEVVIISDFFDEDPIVTVEITYLHQITFPLVGGVFGEPATVGQVQSSFLRMEQSFTYRAQRAPNAEVPQI